MAKSLRCWQRQEASINGVLGGYGALHSKDIRDSRRFLNLLDRQGEISCNKYAFELAAELGAGIGRVSQYLLHDVAEKIHVYEPVEKMLDAARVGLKAHGTRIEFHQQTLQEFSPRVKYDLIWIQWVGCKPSWIQLIIDSAPCM
eukprot:Gregarina_sp_Poly_1__5051@NODE_2679_length_1837_cov_73_841243_g1701_i0_p2_GENE_NODE_2679_length_1837_cov_73_841243_g1701_i0NODE_2679_length_1837_cov_73_841243_g1701_i0_p2_ORF_typecomplete_len144_score12_62Methyltransf_PK/PF05891_12/3_7e32Methyltransf_25/PF13649_6/1_4e08NodS/PF05401_11/1_9e07MTS/PF05175_14/1_9e06Methyltransf_12/PF08242_12/0_00017Methyltransf_11/PF08241_12/0_00058Methyltransf_23/PF13489_6/0_00088Methyltransf_31/PF13847_6/0_0013DREV/PF05219_12/0_0014Methyltransf_24/PF13578_6/0_043U